MGNVLSRVHKPKTSEYGVFIAENPRYRSKNHSMGPEVEITMKSAVLKKHKQALKRIEYAKKIFLKYKFTHEESINAADHILERVDPSRQNGNPIELDALHNFSKIIEDFIDCGNSFFTEFLEKVEGMSAEDAKSCVLALSLYAGPKNKDGLEWNNKSLGIESFLDRVFNSRIPLPKNERYIPEHEKPDFILVSWLFKALNALPTYSGKCTRVLSLSNKEQALYDEGTIFAWKYLNSFTQNENPREYHKNENTRFIVEQSRTGRSIAKFSKCPDQNEVIFSSGSSFIVTKKEVKERMTFIYLKEVELGNTENTIIWVDGRVESKNYRYQRILDRFLSREHLHRISLVRKSSYVQAVAFLESPFGRRIKNVKIIIILEEPQKCPFIDVDAVIEFLKDKTFHVNPPFTGWHVKTRGEALERLFIEEIIERIDENCQIREAKCEGYFQGNFNSNNIDLMSTNMMSIQNSKNIDPISPNDIPSVVTKDLNVNSENQPENAVNYVNGDLRAYFTGEASRVPKVHLGCMRIG